MCNWFGKPNGHTAVRAKTVCPSPVRFASSWSASVRLVYSHAARNLNSGGKLAKSSSYSQLAVDTQSAIWLAPCGPAGQTALRKKIRRILAGILGHGAVVMLHSHLMGILHTWRPSNAIIEVLWRFRLLQIIILIMFPHWEDVQKHCNVSSEMTKRKCYSCGVIILNFCLL